MANGSLLDRLVWQFRHLWQNGNKARLSVECDHEGHAFASLHVGNGVQSNGRRKQQPPLPTVCPPKSTHTQTPKNLSCDKETDTSSPLASVNTESTETQESVGLHTNTNIFYIWGCCIVYK